MAQSTLTVPTINMMPFDQSSGPYQRHFPAENIVSQDRRRQPSLLTANMALNVQDWLVAAKLPVR